MMDPEKYILVVDDEPLNLIIIGEYLGAAEEGYQWETAENGDQAWQMLEEAPERYAAVLLDRMMPKMDGMQVLARIKTHPVLKEVPVILQTARAAKEDIEEGIKAGAYYYLTKPYQEEELLSIVRTAVHDHLRYLALRRELDSKNAVLALMHSSEFRYRTLEEARNLASILAQACPSPETTITGLVELMVNAVEHGNLSISYDEKGELNDKGKWEQEVQRRLQLPEFRDKQVDVTFTRENGEIRITITDQGEGFDCQPYLEISAERGAHNHGRGIALARMISFERLEYQGMGNQVLAVIRDY
jgi:CheY-like chemotaxis protein